MEEVRISWKEFGELAEKLAEKIKLSGEEFDGVYGIPRGGLALAVFLSHKLNLPFLAVPTKNSLVADDIADTGITLKGLKYKKIAVLLSTEWTATKPDFSVKAKKTKNDWIVFPWEQ